MSVYVAIALTIVAFGVGLASGVGLILWILSENDVVRTMPRSDDEDKNSWDYR